MSRPGPQSNERMVENSSSSLDPRQRISPDRHGISSLAAAAGNQSLDEPKKYKV